MLRVDEEREFLRRSWTLPVFTGVLITALRLVDVAERVATELREVDVALLVAPDVRDAVTLVAELVPARTPLEERVAEEAEPPRL